MVHILDNYFEAKAKARALRKLGPARRFAPPPPQKRAVITDDTKFAQTTDTFSVGDEFQRPNADHARSSAATVDLGDVHDKAFSGLYDPNNPTKRNYSPHKPVVVEYSDRLIDGVPHYWHAATRVWSTRPPKPTFGRKRK